MPILIQAARSDPNNIVKVLPQSGHLLCQEIAGFSTLSTKNGQQASIKKLPLEEKYLCSTELALQGMLLVP